MSTLNLTLELERLIADIVKRMDEFNHVDPARLLVCVASTRGGGIHGAYAKIHPLCFENGRKSVVRRRGRRTATCTMPTITHLGIEMLYVIYFLVPRFIDLPLREKLITVFHELYHISPAFDGDIRRFPGRNYAHGSSTKKYNACMSELVARYLEKLPDHTLVGFLDGDMAALRSRHRAIVARRRSMPRIAFSY
jgi:predicted metallopeptidase